MRARERFWEAHINLGPRKPVSYLPLNTVENVLGITTSAYCSLVETSVNKAAVFPADECCIKSGAVYAYSFSDLQDLLRDNRELLAKHRWPIAPHEFVRRIARDWLYNDHPIMPVIIDAFGE